ncbi:hypothetical protein HPG69_019235 [Diceros bicornis minor]|uniref:SLC26A/SulP transporter domain-containing protein n=1 Tax=Diceros bicornis minor TaxID=77932 RepID=A0A7J7FNJ8_DICBM|nr:hypothetical protein HPG69_019235 [Diceros bicornis minor]
MSLLVSYTFHVPASAVLLAFLWSCIQLAMGFLHLARIPVDFISCPVIKSFTSPATVTVGFRQLKGADPCDPNSYTSSPFDDFPVFPSPE